jgi:uncharacterized lipoprotein YmbA
MSRWLSAIALFLILSGCGRELPKLEIFDLEQWEKDKNACGSYRTDKSGDHSIPKGKAAGIKRNADC